MIFVNMIGMQLVKVALLRSNHYGQSSLFTFKRALTTVDSIGRVKREEVRDTEYDSAFSEWKVLITARDWKDHSVGKGAQRYKMQNLPQSASCPGIYELGIATSSKIDHVVPVYLGHAQNVRTRLQHYGRDGAHLENYVFSNKDFVTNCPRVSYLKEHRLFSDTLDKELSIFYRFVEMKSKEDAEKIEGQLLQVYDYAWNKRRNGDRRPDDIRIIFDFSAKESLFSLILRIVKRILSL